MNVHKKNTALIKKEAVHPNYYRQLFNYFNQVPIQDLSFEPFLKERSTGFYSIGYHTLLSKGTVMPVCWFINSGAIVLLYTDPKNREATYRIFTQGELATLDISFNNGHPSFCTFIACPDTHLLELSKSFMDQMHLLFPPTREVIRQILTKQDKTQELASFAKLGNKERMIHFIGLYPDLLGGSATVKILHQFLASYISISKYEFSKLLRVIELDHRQPN